MIGDNRLIFSASRLRKCWAQNLPVDEFTLMQSTVVFVGECGLYPDDMEFLKGSKSA